MSVRQFAVLGAGVMGSGIAYQAASCGKTTRLSDLSPVALNKSKQQIEQILIKQRERGRIDQKRCDEVHSLLHYQTGHQGFAEVELLVEAVVENESVKVAALQAVQSLLASGAVLATNTSTISIDHLATHLQNPERFCGLHFFNPVPQMQLIEVVQGRQTSAETIATCVEFARQLNKHPVVVKDCPGFLVNRILFPYFHGFDLLVKQGVSIDRIDRVMEEFGWSMGPGYLADVIGMDVMVGADAVLQRGYPERMGYNEPSVFEQLLEQGMLGQKSGAGFYRHSLTSSGERLRVINREAVNHYLCADREVSDDDIHWRMMLPMMTEALRTMNDDVVSGPEDLTLAAKLGLGFPDHQGGLWGYIEALDTVELQRLLSRYKHLGELYNYG